MSVYSWEVFVTVAEQQSFVRAAEVLHVTQSAVSHIIKKLEEESNVVLFVRNRNKVELTPNGELMLPLARNLIECSRSIDQMLSEIDSVAKGVVRVAAFNSASKLWLPKIIRSFSSKYPGITVRITQTGDENISRLTEEGKVDLAFLPTGYSCRGSFEPVYRTQMLCLAPEGFVPANGTSVTPEDLEGQNVIIQVEGYDIEMRMWLDENKVSVRDDYRFEVDSTCHEYVRQGLGFFLTSELMLKADPTDGVSVWAVKPEAYRTIGLVTVYPNYAPRSVQLFREEIMEYMSKC